MRTVIKILATGFGVGFAPILGGTLGTLVAIPFFLALSSLSAPVYLVFLLFFTGFSVWVADQALPLFVNAKKAGDPSQIVIDEVAGFFWSAGILQYAGFWNPKEGMWSFLLLSFLFFRLFDVVKKGPVGWAERKWHGGLGIVMDDVVAGIMAGITSILFCIAYPFVVYIFTK
ncbi:MAG: phosphatidylglycerophosphatase A [Deltaproteobacteria bacterium]|nr:phosphatidylglycerophosphatase A [Deltaproteobacteria bacterium]